VSGALDLGPTSAPTRDLSAKVRCMQAKQIYQSSCGTLSMTPAMWLPQPHQVVLSTGEGQMDGVGGGKELTAALAG
jgi:hypothetical protein